MRKIDQSVVDYYSEKITSLNDTVNEIIDTEKAEKEAQIAEIELEKAQKKTENNEPQTEKRFNWFSNRDAKGMKIEKKPGGKRKKNDEDGDDDDEDEEAPRSKKSKKSMHV